MKKTMLTFTGFLLCIVTTFAQSTIISATPAAKKAELYRKAEWNIDLRADFDNPYLQEEVSLDMELVSPSGKKLLLPCYYESGQSGGVSHWKARFAPQETGKYRYAFILKQSGRTVFTTKQAAFSARATKDKGILHAHDSWSFRFDNGELFRGIGENICWESRANDDSRYFKALHEKLKYNYEDMLRSLASHGGNYFRTWICSWNLPLDWKTGINNPRYKSSGEYFHPEAIRKLDRLVTLSDSLGLYIMLTLGPGTHDARQGRYAVSSREFFVDAKAKAQYRNRLRFIVARWGYSPAIGAWEFFNEIDNVQFRDRNNPISASSIVQWHTEMSNYLKSIDPYEHLVTTSISHRDLEGLNSIPDIDFNQKHIYKHNRALPTTIVQYTQQFGKPYVIGEFGYEYDWQKNFNEFADSMDSDFKRGLWYGLFVPTPVLPMSWWWEFFDDRGTDAYIANVRTILDDMMRAGKGSFANATASSSEKATEVYAVKCGNSTYVYVYNPTTSAVTADISVASAGAGKWRAYDCETGKYGTLQGRNEGGNAVAGVRLAPNTDRVLVLDK
jgi:hypothetical protein